MKRLLLLAASLLLLAACQVEGEADAEPTPVPTVDMMAIRDQMQLRHQATIPEEYAGLVNPVSATEEVLADGEDIYATYCTVCHGETGMGEGAAGQTLNPVAAPVAQTSQMLGDDYLFWRVSEGGTMDPFNSAMPTWSNTLSEEERWAVITYIQSLGANGAGHNMSDMQHENGMQGMGQGHGNGNGNGMGGPP